MASGKDLVATCWTCAPLEKYVGLTKDFTDRLGDSLQEPMLILFASLGGLWVVVTAIRFALRMTDWPGIIKDFAFITITGVLLGAKSTGLISYIYSTAISLMAGTSASIFALAGDVPASTGYSGMTALAANGEKAIAKVIQAVGAIWTAGSLYEIANYAYGVILGLPYFLLIVAYASQVVVAIFRATMIGVFGPFLFMAFAFNWGRGMAQSGAKTLLASVLVLFASTASLSLTIFGVNSLTLNPAELTGGNLNDFASITNPEFLVILFLGWTGTALLAEGTSIANSIAGTALTNTATGILTAGMSGAAMFGLKKSPGAIGSAATAISHGWFWGQNAMANPEAAAANLVDKFKNINKPGGGA